MPPAVAERVTMLGLISEDEKERMLRSVDLYIAPNTGGESFGIILTEAMAAGAPVVASDIDAFRRVLEDGACGALFPVGDADALAATVDDLLDDPARRAILAGEARRSVDDPRRRGPEVGRALRLGPGGGGRRRRLRDRHGRNQRGRRGHPHAASRASRRSVLPPVSSLP
jgi:glycosyltransferase involved in cell wall biosynthesis